MSGVRVGEMRRSGVSTEEDRHHHEARAVSGCHQEGPHCEPQHADAHPAEARVAVPEKPPPTERDEDGRHGPAKGFDRHSVTQRDDSQHQRADGDRVPGAKWDEGSPDLSQTEADRSSIDITQPTKPYACVGSSRRD